MSIYVYYIFCMYMFVLYKNLISPDDFYPSSVVATELISVQPVCPVSSLLFPIPLFT